MSLPYSRRIAPKPEAFTYEVSIKARERIFYGLTAVFSEKHASRSAFNVLKQIILEQEGRLSGEDVVLIDKTIKSHLCKCANHFFLDCCEYVCRLDPSFFASKIVSWSCPNSVARLGS